MDSTVTTRAWVNTGAVEHLSSESISDEDLQNMIHLSVLAFEKAKKEEGDTSHDFVFGEDSSVPPLYFRQIIRAGMARDAVYVVRSENQDIIGMGLFMKPEQKAYSTEQIQRVAGYYEFLEKMKPETRHWYENDLLSLLKDREALFTDEERERRWWCIHLCTDPRFHGKGLGRMIVDHIHQEAQKNGQFLGLAAGNELNVRKYKALGFKQRGYHTAPGLEAKGEPYKMYTLTKGI
ncbi:hypothetical protein BDP27DRAFT_1432697 [Rhodocollybia butyracea]|uniref:N-acetyltransferase domain-containing protein n=1 Tax=Rhodocollybia butyracea TaxID=206335 RepID=A0A9P5P733_9AGAR|nr:hypothetical protein BDP27DRAFT_1432697 [Rhodocollybia butyracea]